MTKTEYIVKEMHNLLENYKNQPINFALPEILNGMMLILTDYIDSKIEGSKQ